MILTCPSCETQYFADDATIGDSGRTVKCAACGHSWHARVKDGVSEASPISSKSGAHETYREKVRERRQRKSRFAASMAWFVSGILFASILGGMILFRNDVVRQWPQSAQAYQALGLAVNRFGLDFNSIDPQRTFDGTTPVLSVSGTVVNVSSVSQPSADIRIRLRDENGEQVGELTTTMPGPRIEPGQEVAFTARQDNPPVEAFELEFLFVTAGGEESAGQRGGSVEAAPVEVPPDPDSN